MPAGPSGYHRSVPVHRDVPLVRREPLEGAYFLLTFRHAEVAHEARPGQYVMIKAGTSAEPPLRRPFSLMSVSPGHDTFTLFVKAVGVGTQALTALQPEEIAQCLGPLGRSFEAPRAGSQAVMVAGGYGIAPFLMLAGELAGKGGACRVFYGGRSAADLQIRDAFAELDVPLVAVTQDGSLGERGLVTDPLERYLDGLPSTEPSPTLYACGPDAMLHAVARVAERRGLACQVSLDPWMGCGIGTCLGCVVRIQGPEEPQPKYRCACTEGPVFDSRLVVWHGAVSSVARRAAVAQ